MAAIIEPRSFEPTLIVGARPSPRHLSSVPGLVDGVVPARGGVGSWLSPSAVMAMVATIALAIGLTVVLASGALPASPTGATPSRAGGPAGSAVKGDSSLVVKAGDSYWSIARELQPHGDVRSLVHQIQVLNSQAQLRPGMEILIPS